MQILSNLTVAQTRQHQHLEMSNELDKAKANLEQFKQKKESNDVRA